jgi:hypothetical protein
MWVHFDDLTPALEKCAWGRGFYDLQISNGKRHQAAIRRSPQMIRILFRCRGDRAQYLTG